MSDNLNKFYEITKNKPPHRRTVDAINILAVNRQLFGIEALDFGCGAGRDSAYMASLGMHVTSVDANTSGIINNLHDIPNIQVVQSSFDEFEFQKYDFISSQFALSFNSPESFDSTFKKLVESLSTGGVITCNIFGPNDEWVHDPTKTFLDEIEIRSIISANLEVLDLKEVEEDGYTADGTPKHWHYFDMIMRRNSS